MDQTYPLSPNEIMVSLFNGISNFVVYLMPKLEEL